MSRRRKPKVFVSYSRHDEALVKPLAGLLGVATDDAVFFDVTSLKPGDAWREEIERAIAESKVFVLCWCCESERSEFIAHEIEAALNSEGKRLVPVLFCSAPLPRSLADKQWIDLKGRVVHSCITHQSRPPQSKQIFGDDPNVKIVMTEHSNRADHPKNFPSRRKVMLAVVGVFALVIAAGFYYFWPRAIPSAPSAPSAVPEVGAAPPSPMWFPIRLLLWVVICVGLVLLLRRAFRALRKRKERLQTEKLAAVAKSYFEGLGK